MYILIGLLKILSELIKMEPEQQKNTRLPKYEYVNMYINIFLLIEFIKSTNKFL